MASLLFTVGGAVNALAFSGNNFVGSSVGSRIMVQKNAKDMIQHLNGFKEQEMNGIETK